MKIYRKVNQVKMLFRYKLLLLITILGNYFNPSALRAQSLAPYTPKVDAETLTPYGIQLIQDAVQLIRFREFDLALSRAELATQLAPNQYETWFILGTLYGQQQENKKAIDALLTAKKIAPTEAEILFSLGNSYFQMGEYQSAIQELENGLGINSAVPQAYFDLGNSHLQLKQFNQAITAYRQAIKLDEKFWPATNNIGIAQYEQGDRRGALTRWREALTAVEERQAEPLLAIAVALFSEGETSEAIKTASEALTIDGQYGNIDYLIKNLWGENLIRDTKTFFATPTMKSILEEKLIPME